MNVRAATVDDVEGIRRVARRTWSAAYEDVVGREDIEAAMREWYAPEAVERQIEAEDTGYFVAAADERVVGYASAGPSGVENCGELYSIYVDPGRWGGGIGSQLLARTTDYLAGLGFDRMRVAVLAGNDVGNAFYRRTGFELSEENEIELFTGEPFDEFVYHREIE